MTKNKAHPLAKSVNFASKGGLTPHISDGGISNYINMVKSIKHLTANEEYELAVKVQRDHDLAAAEKLIKSNLYLVVATAFEYKGYGLPIADIISEGNIGLMKAVRRYDPERGFRLSTYALWWIRATINEFILSSWSLVKIGTQAAHKKLFFGLNRLKAKLGIYHDGNMSTDEVRKIAHTLDVKESDVIEMNARLQRDASLNRPAGPDDDEEKVAKLASGIPTAEEQVAEHEISYMKMKLLFLAMDKLAPREQLVINRRRLAEPPATLEELASELGISKERVRQIEARAMEKLTAYLLKYKKEYDANT